MMDDDSIVKNAIQCWRSAAKLKEALIKEKQKIVAKANSAILQQSQIMEEHEPLIIKYLQENNYSGLDFDNGISIKINKVIMGGARKIPYSKERIEKALVDTLEKNDDIKKILDAIDIARTVETEYKETIYKLKPKPRPKKKK